MSTMANSVFNNRDPGNCQEQAVQKKSGIKLSQGEIKDQLMSNINGI